MTTRIQNLSDLQAIAIRAVSESKWSKSPESSEIAIWIAVISPVSIIAISTLI